MCKYKKWYISIVTKAKERGLKKTNLIGYYEKHHIVPKALGGDNLPNNLVLLTGREHFVCHILLYKMTTVKEHKIKMGWALNRFAYAGRTDIEQKTSYKVNSRLYEIAKKAYAESRSNTPGWNKGKSFTEEQKILMRKPKSNTDNMGKYIRTDDVKNKFRNSRIGKGIGINNSMSDSAKREKVRQSKLGRKLAHNPQTKERKYIFPDSIPVGFILGPVG